MKEDGSDRGPSRFPQFSQITKILSFVQMSNFHLLGILQHWGASAKHEMMWGNLFSEAKHHTKTKTCTKEPQLLGQTCCITSDMPKDSQQWCRDSCILSARRVLPVKNPQHTTSQLDTDIVICLPIRSADAAATAQPQQALQVVFRKFS